MENNLDHIYVVDDIEAASADESKTILQIEIDEYPGILPGVPNPPLDSPNTVYTLDFLQGNPRFHTLSILGYRFPDDAAVTIFRDHLPSSITNVILGCNELENEQLEILLPAFYNTSVTSLAVTCSHVQGQHGGQVIRTLLVGNNSLGAFDLSGNPIGPEGAIGTGQGIARNYRLTKLNLSGCSIGNDGLSNLLHAANGIMINNTLTDLSLSSNRIQGAEGGRHVSLLLQRFTQLKVLNIEGNPIGPLGATALAPGLTSIPNLILDTLHISQCGLGNDGAANLVPQGQVYTSITNLYISYNGIQGVQGGEVIATLICRCTMIEKIDISINALRSEGAQKLAHGLQQQQQQQDSLSSSPRRFRQIDMRACHIGDDGIHAFSQNNINLERLEICHNDITSRGLESIACIMSRCKTMDTLDISYNDIVFNDIFKERPAVEKFASAISGHSFLRVLGVRQSIPDPGAPFMFQYDTHDLDDWVQTTLMSGIVKNSSLRVVNGNFSPENINRLASFSQRNDMISNIKSLNDKTPSVAAVHLALRKMCHHNVTTGASAAFVLMQSQVDLLFPPPSNKFLGVKRKASDGMSLQRRRSQSIA